MYCYSSNKDANISSVFQLKSTAKISYNCCINLLIKPSKQTTRKQIE